MRVLLVGDVHGRFNDLNALINKKLPDEVWCLGDFGFWPGHDQFGLETIKPGKAIVRFLDGNHENHDALEKLYEGQETPAPIEVAPQIWYMPRGTVTITEDGRKVLWMGGAYSIDKPFRTAGYDWFYQETIREKDIWKVPDEKIDILLTHTCAQRNLSVMLRVQGEKSNDPSNLYIDWILNRCMPEEHYFAHWHTWKKGAYTMTMHWECLNMATLTGWWKWL